MSNDELNIMLKEGESDHLAYQLFFGHESIETLVAFANTEGGALLLGISELKEIKGIPDAKENIDHWIPEIRTRTTPQLCPHIEIIEIEEKIVVCISVTEYPSKPVAFEGKYYKRLNKFTKELSIKEVIDFRRQSIDSHWDSHLRHDKTIRDISFVKLYQLIERISRKKQSHPEEPLAFLRKYGLTEGEAITNACWLLFFPEEDAETTIELGRFSSPTVALDTLTLKTDLFTETEEAIHFIYKYIDKENQTNEPVQWQYPIEAIRELVVNMIIHRDYTSDYNSIIKIFDGYIEFYNPGTLPEDLSFRHLLSNGDISRSHNPQIAELFKDAGIFEEYGSGIRKIHSAFVDSGLRPPEFIKLSNRLIVRIFGEPVLDTDTSANSHTDSNNEISIDFDIDFNTDSNNALEQQEEEEVIENFSDREQQIITLILEDNRILLNEIAQKLTVSKRTILRDIKKMKKESIIERIGNEKNGYWKITS